MNRTIHFVAGLPRSGSTLLMNLLGQNPRFYVTPTSGLVEMLTLVRNNWDRNEALRAQPVAIREQSKRNVLAAMMEGYFAHAEHPVCFDKSRAWLEVLEMAAEVMGGRERLRVLVTVRDLRDVVASFERLHRLTAAISQPPMEGQELIRSRTALGRVEMFIDNGQPIGRAYHAIRDAVTRGWRGQMHFVEYDRLTREPAATLAAIYAFLGEEPFPHQWEDVAQITHEDDSVYGFRELHRIRSRVEPAPPQWGTVFDRPVTSSKVWKELERIAQFWRDFPAS